jgi:hypothetical protein
MNGTFTSYAAVLMMPVGQVAQRRTIRRSERSAAPGLQLLPLKTGDSAIRRPALIIDHRAWSR